eukprot:1662064-Amphidinium_carterae.1
MKLCPERISKAFQVNSSPAPSAERAKWAWEHTSQTSLPISVTWNGELGNQCRTCRNQSDSGHENVLSAMQGAFQWI